MSDPFSLKIDPIQIRTKEFKRSIGGYNPSEVASYLDWLAKNWELVQKREQSLLEEVSILQSKLKDWENKEKKLHELREKAEADVEKLREHATVEAEKYFEQVCERANSVRQQTEGWIENVIKKLEETEERRRHFLDSFRDSLDKHYELLSQSEGILPPDRNLKNLFEKAPAENES